LIQINNAGTDRPYPAYIMPKRIFVPIDGSSCSIRALRHAIALAQRLGDCAIHIAHAHEEPIMYGDISIYASREAIERMQREHSEQALAGAESILQSAGVLYEKEILIGDVPRMLAERAAALGCDAIVMGTHGQTALGNLLMGSVATKVVHHSAIPVTLVK